MDEAKVAFSPLNPVRTIYSSLGCATFQAGSPILFLVIDSQLEVGSNLSFSLSLSFLLLSSFFLRCVL